MLMRGENMFIWRQTKVYRAGTPNQPCVALTFDDGPDNKWTPKILDILRDKRVKSTFFVLGKFVERYPEIAKRITSEGHIIASHTYNHANLPRLTEKNIAAELDRASSAIDRATGKTPRLLRPPYGGHSPKMLNVTNSKGYFTVLWSIDTEDWRSLSASAIKRTVVQGTGSGDIVLFHSGEGPNLKGTVEALPGIINNLKGKGFTLVTVAELLELPAYRQ